MQKVYPTIDPSFLNMKHPDLESYTVEARSVGVEDETHKFKVVLPRFAVYSLNSPDCVVSMTVKCCGGESCHGQSVERPNLPFELSSPLTTAISIEGKKGGIGWHPYKEVQYTFSSQFTGGIPRDIKNKIKVAKREFGKDLYVIAEADSWEIKGVRELSPTTDPLIVGVKAQQCFLVSEFNCTPLEDYVKSEFTTS